MANFKEAFEITSGHEGGYVNDPDDVGGETYRGISRRYNPTWEGWEVIDDCKRFEFGIEECLKMKGDLIDTLVETFYKSRYWDPFWGDEISSQIIANELYDTSVNMGVSRAVTFLQESLNCLNRNGTLYTDLVIDGAFGSATMRAFDSLPEKDHITLFKMLNAGQASHYMEYMRKSPTQEKYARGWFNRVGITKEQLKKVMSNGNSEAV